jgi:hypothetical protein
MKTTKLSLILLFFIPVFSFSQAVNNGVPPADEDSFSVVPKDIIDGSFKKELNQNKTKAFEYPEINEKDIVWSKTIWREVDLNQKMNHHFYFPAVQNRYHLNQDKMSLIDVILEAIQGYTYRDEDCNKCGGSGTTSGNSVLGTEQECLNCLGTKSKFRCFNIGVNAKAGNEFKYGLKTKEDKMRIGLGPIEYDYPKDDQGAYINDSIETFEDGTPNPNFNNPIRIEAEVDPFDRRKVVSWKIKEEWFFDKKRSVMDVRIIGLAPCVEVLVGGKEILEPLFWIYYPDFRDVLLNTRVTNYTKNNAQERSFLGVFEKRMFVSRITMESNIMNREISDYMIGLDALLESERIKEEIFNIEHDMWEY